MPLITVHFEGRTIEIEHDITEDIEVLSALIMSYGSTDCTSLTLIDCFGRMVTSSSDLYCVSEEANKSIIWALNSKLCGCTCQYFGSDLILQPVHKIIDTSFVLCTSCRQFVDDSLCTQRLLEFAAVTCNRDKLVEIGFLSNDFTNTSTVSLSAPLRLYLQRELYKQLLVPKQPEARDEQFLKRIQIGFQTFNVYLDRQQQSDARAAVNLSVVQQYMREIVHIESVAVTNTPNTAVLQSAFIKALLKWFKHDCFSWCNKPKCRLCNDNGDNMHSFTNSEAQQYRGDYSLISPSPLPEEVPGWASRFEVYWCSTCSKQGDYCITRFPRYNNPSFLLKNSRSGRCGEWSNAFALLCQSFGFHTRYVMDFTDHVWVEIFSFEHQRFVHLDPCENAFDMPLVYELGWGKRLTHVLSFGINGVVDIAGKHSRSFTDVVVRRHQQVANEAFAVQKLEEICNEKSLNWSQKSISLRGAVSSWSTFEWLNVFVYDNNPHISRYEAMIFDIPMSEAVGLIHDQQLNLKREAERMQFTKFTDVNDTSKKEDFSGRISGDYLWRLSRGEEFVHYTFINEKSWVQFKEEQSQVFLKAVMVVDRYSPQSIVTMYKKFKNKRDASSG